MKTLFFAAAAVSAVLAAPAFAQDAPAASGPRLEALVGFDSISLSLEDLGVDDSLEQSGFLYGVGLGYDFALGGMSLGLDVEATDSTAELGDDDYGAIDAARDLYAGARVTFPVASNINAYVKGGYTNARFKGEFDGESEGDNLDGFRLGAGAQVALSGKAFVGTEYRYSNYEADLTRHQFALVVGTRF